LTNQCSPEKSYIGKICENFARGVSASCALFQGKFLSFHRQNLLDYTSKSLLQIVQAFIKLLKVFVFR